MRWGGSARNSNSNHDSPTAHTWKARFKNSVFPHQARSSGHLSSCPAPRQSQLLPATVSPSSLPLLGRPLPLLLHRDGSTQTTYSRVRPTVTHQHTLMIHPSLEVWNKTRVFFPLRKEVLLVFQDRHFACLPAGTLSGARSSPPYRFLSPFGTSQADSRTALKTYSRQQSGRGQTCLPGVLVLPPALGRSLAVPAPQLNRG